MNEASLPKMRSPDKKPTITYFYYAVRKDRENANAFVDNGVACDMSKQAQMMKGLRNGKQEHKINEMCGIEGDLLKAILFAC